jgi:hypothetical protein
LSEPRRIRGYIVNFTPDGSIIAHGAQGEFLILELGWAQILALQNDLDKYAEYYRPKEAPCSP